MPASNPNFGTGAVDWSNYVGANQATTDRDRQQVADYLGGQDTAARGAAQNAFQKLGYDATVAQGGDTSGAGRWNFKKPGAIGGAVNPPTPPSSGQATTPTSAQDSYNNIRGNLETNQSALQTPEGFTQVLGQAQQNYDPNNKTGPGGTAAPPKGAQGNSFDAALEGQNAGKLYSGLDSLDSYAQSFAAPPPRVAPAAASVPDNGPTDWSKVGGNSADRQTNAGSDDSGSRGASPSAPPPTQAGVGEGGIGYGTPDPTYDPNDPNDPRNKNQNYGGGG